MTVRKYEEIFNFRQFDLRFWGKEGRIKTGYIEIGKLYYAERGMAPEAAYAALCEKITAAKVNIEENKNRIEELKNEGGIADTDVIPAEATVVEAPAPEASKDSPEVKAPVESLAEDIPPQE